MVTIVVPDTPLPQDVEALGRSGFADKSTPDVQPTRKKSSMRGIRLVVADDHPVVREGLVELFRAEADLHVVGEARNGREAVDLVSRLRPEVVVLDVSMPEMDGIEAAKIIKSRWPGIRVVGLSMYSDTVSTRRMIAAGADCFVAKAGSTSGLLEAIRGLGTTKKDG